MAPNDYLRLQTIGRKTGRPHEVLLRYISAGSNLVVFPGKEGKQSWLLNIKRNPSVRVVSENKSFEGLACIKAITGLDDPLLRAFTRKYGRNIVNQFYIGQYTYIELTLDKIEGRDYTEFVYRDLETAFDGVAKEYDRHIFGNPINTWLRNVSTGVMADTFRPGSTVLEIGCGTGTETLALARRGIKVVATDISGKMVEILQKKAGSARLSGNIFAIRSRPSELKEKMAELGLGKLDGAYSNYGAINTEPRLQEMIRTLHGLLKENAPLVLGVWNKFCLSEILGYIIRLKPTLAVARFRNPVPVGRSRFCVSTNAFSVSSLSKLTEPYFVLKSVLGVVILLPPSNLTRYLPSNRVFRLLRALDLNMGRAFPLNRLGDHFLAVYNNRSGG